MHRCVSERFEVSLSRSSCLNYPRLHGAGSAPLEIFRQRSQEALVKADETKRETFVAE